MKLRLTDKQKCECIVGGGLHKILDPSPNKKYKDDIHYCFLDEKWFFATLWRKKMKILPKAPFKTKEQAKAETKNLEIGNSLPKLCLWVLCQGQLVERWVERYKSGVCQNNIQQVEIHIINKYQQTTSPIMSWRMESGRYYFSHMTTILFSKPKRQ